MFRFAFDFVKTHKKLRKTFWEWICYEVLETMLIITSNFGTPDIFSIDTNSSEEATIEYN